ncbi:uncharacterized protein LOC134537581 isoform X2 [Bacillus rossius redtenbacheri]
MPKVKEKLSARHLLRMTTEETCSRLTYLQTVENVSHVSGSEINTLLNSGSSSCSGSTSYLTHSEKESETVIISDKISTPHLLNNDSDSTLNTDSLDSHNIFNNPPDLNILLPKINLVAISKIPNLGSEIAELNHNIANWALENNISLVALSALLKILKTHPCHAELPSDARSFLGTPRHNKIKQISPGCYFHFGLKKELEHFVGIFSYDKPVLELSIFVDGLPLSRSSSSCFWPILASVVPYKHILIIGIYHGYEKPKSANDFLHDFVEEAVFLCKEGLCINGKNFSVLIGQLICDAPAKSFVLNVKGHSGYSSCTKCCVQGDYRERRICFPVNEANKRTDDAFLHLQDDDYHLGISILVQIPNFGPVSNVPLDYMHLVCLGVTRKMIHLWLKGNACVRLRSSNVAVISDCLESIRGYTPSEFARKPRSLTFLNLWKATEFRQFLLYTGPVVTQSVLENDVYLNFLGLHIAIRYLCTDQISVELLEYVRLLLEHFVTSFGILYGTEHMSHNVHGILHLTDDVKNLGPLDKFSAFKFENYLQVLKKRIRKSEKPLQQLICRYSEIKMKSSSIETERPRPTCIKVNEKTTHLDGPLTQHCVGPQYKNIKYQKFEFFTYKEADKCCGFEDGTIILIENICHSVVNNDIVIIGKEFLVKDDLYSIPCKSSDLGIYLVDSLSPRRSWLASLVCKKFYMIPYKQKFAVVPLLHQEK